VWTGEDGATPPLILTKTGNLRCASPAMTCVGAHGFGVRLRHVFSLLGLSVVLVGGAVIDLR
jgi:hypothetical protein